MEDQSIYVYNNNTIYSGIRYCAHCLGLKESSIRTYFSRNWTHYKGYRFERDKSKFPANAKIAKRGKVINKIELV